VVPTSRSVATKRPWRAWERVSTEVPSDRAVTLRLYRLWGVGFQDARLFINGHLKPQSSASGQYDVSTSLEQTADPRGL
jgi:hypothetical protein